MCVKTAVCPSGMFLRLKLKIKITCLHHIQFSFERNFAAFTVAKEVHCNRNSILEILTIKEAEHPGLGIEMVLHFERIYLPTPSPKLSVPNTNLYLTSEIEFLDLCRCENHPQEKRNIHVSSQVLVISLPHVELQ